jgi:hypothetical protein
LTRQETDGRGGLVVGAVECSVGSVNRQSQPDFRFSQIALTLVFLEFKCDGLVPRLNTSVFEKTERWSQEHDQRPGPSCLSEGRDSTSIFVVPLRRRAELHCQPLFRQPKNHGLTPNDSGTLSVCYLVITVRRTTVRSRRTGITKPPGDS